LLYRFANLADDRLHLGFRCAHDSLPALTAPAQASLDHLVKTGIVTVALFPSLPAAMIIKLYLWPMLTCALITESNVVEPVGRLNDTVAPESSLNDAFTDDAAVVQPGCIL